MVVYGNACGLSQAKKDSSAGHVAGVISFKLHVASSAEHSLEQKTFRTLLLIHCIASPLNTVLCKLH